MKRSDKRRLEVGLTLPALIWILVLFVVPSLILIASALKPSDLYGGILPGWTLDTLKILTETTYLKLLWRTTWMSLLATSIVLTLSLPIGYYLAKIGSRWRHILLLLIIVPFWSSFLIRIFAWKSFLHPEGFMRELLLQLHLIDANTSLLYNRAAVILVMVYAYLPFGILPIYAAASKFEWQLMEAGVDLGCTPLQCIFHIFLPGIRRGIITAFIMVFIPAMGAYVIPDLVGGPSSEMLANKIVQRTLVVRNIPESAALSLLLGAAIILPVLLISLWQKRAFDPKASRNIE